MTEEIRTSRTNKRTSDNFANLPDACKEKVKSPFAAFWTIWNLWALSLQYLLTWMEAYKSSTSRAGCISVKKNEQNNLLNFDELPAIWEDTETGTVVDGNGRESSHTDNYTNNFCYTRKFPPVYRSHLVANNFQAMELNSSSKVWSNGLDHKRQFDEDIKFYTLYWYLPEHWQRLWSGMFQLGQFHRSSRVA